MPQTLLILSITLFISYFATVNEIPNTIITKVQNRDTTGNIISEEKIIYSQVDKAPEKKKNEAILIVNKNEYQPVKLSQKAYYIDKGKSLFKILKNNDSTILINLIKGELQFSVKTGSYKKFAVITRHAEVRVTGTIFSVYTDSSNTNTTVYRGSVLITDKSGVQTILKANESNTLNINFEGTINMQRKNLSIIDTSKSFLNEFLNQYTPGSKKQLPVDSVISDLNNITYQLLDSINKTLSPEIEAQLMHFNAGIKLIAENREKDALRIFEEMLAENLSKKVKLITIIKLGQLYLKNDRTFFKSDFIDKIRTSSNVNVYRSFLLLEIYNDKKNRAFDSFYANSEFFLNNFPDDKLNDYLYWYLAQYDINKSNFNKAISRYENIIDKYPISQFASDAKYRLGWCLINRPKEFSGLR